MIDEPILDDDADDADLGGDLITDDELAGAVADDMGSDDPVVRRLWDDLIRGEHAKAVMAEAETRRVIEFNRSVDHRFQEGVGQLVARIPLSVYLHWAAVHGHEFWDEPDSLDFLAKRAGGGQGNPGLLIETAGKPTLIVDSTFAGVAARQKIPAQGDGAGMGESTGPAGAAGVPPAGRFAVKGRRGRWAA
jgi:hypothetical protein